METADADEIIVPLCIIIICAGLHQLRGQVVRDESFITSWGAGYIQGGSEIFLVMYWGGGG